MLQKYQDKHILVYVNNYMRELEYRNDQDVAIARGVYQNFIRNRP